MRPFGDHLLDEEPAACVPLPHFWQPQRNDIPAIGTGIAETQNRPINLIKPSSMFARRVLQSGRRPRCPWRGVRSRQCDAARMITMMRLHGVRKIDQRWII
jgi:hypothetical protein